MLDMCMLILGTEVAKSSASWFWLIQTIPSFAKKDTEVLPSAVL
jgi:hypothetical protein